MKSHMSGSSSSPGHSQLMAEPLNSSGIQAPPSTKGQGSHFGPAPHPNSILQLTHTWRYGWGSGRGSGQRPWSGLEAAMGPAAGRQNDPSRNHDWNL